MAASTERVDRLIELLKKGVKLGGITPYKFHEGKEFYKIEFSGLDPEVKIGLELETEKTKKSQKQILFNIIKLYEISRGKTKEKRSLLESRLPRQLIFKYGQYGIGVLTLP